MENYEKIPDIKSSVVTGEELHKTIYNRDTGEADARFLPLDRGGVFHYSPLGKFSEILSEGVYYAVISDREEIVGVAEIQQSPFEEDVLWFKSISIDMDRKGEGLSEQLLEEVFNFAKSSSKKLQLSTFTDEGKERVSHKIEGLASKYGVEIISGNR